MNEDKIEPNTVTMMAEIYGHPFDDDDSQLPMLTIEDDGSDDSKVMITITDVDGQSCTATFSPMYVRDALNKFIGLDF